MEIIIRSKNIELTSHLENYTVDKFSAVKKFISPFLEKEEEDTKKVGKAVKRAVLEIELEKMPTGGTHRAEAHLSLPGERFRADEHGETMKEAVDKAREDLQRQVKKYREKQIDLKKKGEREAKKRQTR